MNRVRQWLLLLAAGLGIALMAGCGGGGSASSAQDKPTPPETARDLALATTNLPERAVAVPASTAVWQFNFDAPVAASAATGWVELRDSQGIVPVVVEDALGGLSVRPARPLKLRTDHTLTLKAGLTASTGAVLRSDVVRHFKTVLLDGISRVVQPGNLALLNYPGQHSFRIGDLNGDGRPDIVQIGGSDAANSESNNFAVYVILQNADHSFSRSQALVVQEAQHNYSNEMGELAIIDLDHDGVPEIVIAIQRPLPGLNGLMVLKQDPQGTYAVADFIATDFTHRLFVADIDHDGKPDLLGIGQGRAMTDGPDRCGMVAVLSSAAGARLQPSTLLPCGPNEAALGPLESRGQLQLVLLQSSFRVPPEPFQPRLSLFNLDEKGQPTLNAGLMAAAGSVCAGLQDCSGLMLMDSNGDGLQELLFTNGYVGDGSVRSVLYGRSAGGNYAELTRQNFGAHAYVVADMDRDGLDDVVVIVQPEGSYVAAGFSKTSPGLELSHLVPVSALDTMNQATVGVADLDGDGWPDVVLDSYNTGISVLFQRRQ